MHVVLPSPAGVGLMADTSTSFPSRGPASNAASGLILATPGPGLQVGGAETQVHGDVCDWAHDGILCPLCTPTAGADATDLASDSVCVVRSGALLDCQSRGCGEA